RAGPPAAPPGSASPGRPPTAPSRAARSHSSTPRTARSRPTTPRQGSSGGRSPPDRRPPPTPTSATPRSCTQIVSHLHTRCIQGSAPGMPHVCKRHAGDRPRYASCVHHVCMDDDDWPPDPLNERPRVSASRRAYEHVKQQILDGTLEGTELLSEGDIAQELGVSRTPVR